MDRRFVAFVFLMFQGAYSSCDLCQFEDTVLNDMRALKDTLQDLAGVCSPSPIQTTPSPTPSCPSGWLNYDVSCYLFNTDRLSFLAAQRDCQALNAHLVHINDAGENKFVKDNASRIKNDLYWFIGLTDIFKEGVWVWIDDWSQPKYTDWLKNEPSSSSERCADLHSGANYEWNDSRCDLAYYSICEKPL